MCQRCHRGKRPTGATFSSGRPARSGPPVWSACSRNARGPKRPLRFEQYRRPGSPGVGDGTAAGPARSLAHPRGGTRPPGGFIHIFLPGPEDAVTPFFGAPRHGAGRRAQPDHQLQGLHSVYGPRRSSQGSDGKTYNVESDLRVMGASTSRRTDPSNGAPSRFSEWTCLIPVRDRRSMT